MEFSLLSLLLVLLAAWAGGAVAQRMGYPAVLGELMAGILLGPALFGVIGDGSWLNRWLGVDGGYEPLSVLAEVGVLLLMLYIGMEIDPKELGKASWGGFLAAIGGFITPFVMGWVTVLLFGGTHLTAIFVGIAVGVTSLATKSRILFDLKILDTRIAHVMMAGALIADTLSLIVFAGVIGFAESDTFALGALLMVAGRSALFFGGAGVVGVYVLPLIFRLITRAGIRSRGVYFTLMLLVALAFGEAAHLAGLHALLGTFVAGLFLREGMLEPKAHRELNELLHDVSVVFLAPIFFVTAGFEVSFDVFRTDLWLFVAIMGVAFVGKIVGTALFYLPTGHGWREGVVLGAGMNGRGAVEIILAGVGLQMGLISQEIFSILVFMAIITTATVPIFLKWGTDWLRRSNLLVRSSARRNSVLIVGATETARALGRLLAQSQPVWLIDSNPGRVADARADGLNAVAGNALDTLSLSEAQAAHASVAVAMTGNVEINVLTARQLRDVFLVPEVHVLVQGSGRGADPEAFQHLEATMLFAKPVQLADWDHWFARGDVDEDRIPLPRGTASQVLTLLRQDTPTLPMAYETTHEGVRVVRPLSPDTEFTEGDILITGRVRGSGPAVQDRFDELVRNSIILDIAEPLDRDSFFTRAAEALAAGMSESAELVREALNTRETMSSTILAPGLAVPHIALQGEGRFIMLAVRCRPGVTLEDGMAPAQALFVLAGSQDQRNVHLKALSAIAQIWQSDDFEDRWTRAESVDELRTIMLNAPRRRSAPS